MTTSGTGEFRQSTSAFSGISGPTRKKQRSAFTLVELVIAITVLVIMTGLAVPAFDSVQRERAAREPVNALYLMAREVRLRAMREQRPYVIVFDREGFRASRFLQPYGGREAFEQLQLDLEQMEIRDAMVEASRARGIDLGNGELDPRRDAVVEGLRYTAEYTLDPFLHCSLRFWNDTQWVSLDSGEFHRWIFQPSGMCEPLKFRVEAEKAFFEVEFHPLTADIKSERSWVE